MSTGAGALFGVALTASRVYLPTVIFSQMRLRDFHMLEVFLTASATSAIVLFAFEKLRIAQCKVRPNSTLNWFHRYDANILGGAFVGIGMSLTGACPGTVIVQLANGVKSSIYVAIGAVLGGIFYARLGKSFAAKCESSPPTTTETVGEKLNLNPTKMFLAFETMCAAVVGVATLVTPEASYTWIHPVAGGLLIGGAQAASILLTNTTLGVSTAYEQIGKYFWQALGQKDVAAPPSPPQALIFATGILLGSAILASYMPPAPTEVAQVSKLSGALGGFIMVLGARVAGGCTSGHGISGLSAFSLASLITVVAMFAGGIATAMLSTR